MLPDPTATATSTVPPIDVLVLGAGISGLSTAYALHRAGLRVQMLDAADRPGGVIATVGRDGFVFERGPNSTLDTSPEIGELLAALGLGPRQRWASPAADRRYVVRDGVLRALPMTPAAFLGTPLFSARAKVALLREPFVAPCAAGSEESIATFVRRRLGSEFLDYAIDPFVAGVYAGDPDRISVRAAFPKLHALEQRWGSLLLGQVLGAWERRRKSEVAKNRAHSFSFDAGMQVLTDALAAAVGPIALGARAQTLLPRAGSWHVHAVQAGSGRLWQARSVVLAMPAHQTSALLRELVPAAAAALAAIDYAPLASVASAYAPGSIAQALDGFGCLVPRCERRRILGSLFSSTMFAARAPADAALLTSFVGGQRQPDLAGLPEGDIAALVHAEHVALLGAGRPPLWQEVTRWSQAIPQYTIGHLARVTAAEDAVRQHPGLFLVGNWKGGVAVGDCIRNGRQCAEGVLSWLRPRA